MPRGRRGGAAALDKLSCSGLLPADEISELIAALPVNGVPSDATSCISDVEGEEPPRAQSTTIYLQPAEDDADSPDADTDSPKECSGDTLPVHFTGETASTSEGGN